MPQDIATIIVEDQEFKVHKSLLTEDSRYFDRALNGSFLEGETQTINMGDDITVKEFGLYVDTLYRSSFAESFRLYRTTKLNLAACEEYLLLWKVSDRVLNQRIRDLVQEALVYVTSEFSVANWEQWYEEPGNSDQFLGQIVFTVQKAFRLCQEFNIPWQDSFVECASNMPVQLFTEQYDKLDMDFRTSVMKKMFKRYENPDLKRPAPAGAQGDQPCAKKKKKKGHAPGLNPA